MVHVHRRLRQRIQRRQGSWCCSRAKAHIGMTESMLFTPPDDGCAQRFATKLVGAVLPGGVHCGPLYCISGIGLAAQANVDLLEATSKRLALLRGPWVGGGDFNGTAEELRKTGWLEVVKGTIIQPSGSTCTRGSGRTIDFFVVSNSLVPHVVGAYNIADAGMVKTHSPVRLILGASPGATVCGASKLQQPTRLASPPVRSTNAPHGPCW